MPAYVYYAVRRSPDGSHVELLRIAYVPNHNSGRREVVGRAQIAYSTAAALLGRPAPELR